MPNLVALSVYTSTQAGAAKSVAFPTIAPSGTLEAAPANTVIAGVTMLTKIVIPASGLNQPAKVYYSATALATVATALGYVALTVFKSEQSSSTTVAFPATGAGGLIVETTSGTTIGTTPILSLIKAPATGLNQKERTYYSGQTVAAIVTALG